MFKFLRTVAEALGRAGLKVMTNGVLADWLFCGRGFKGVRCCICGLLLFLESGDYIPRCLTCPFLQEGQTKYTFSATKEERRLNDNLN